MKASCTGSRRSAEPSPSTVSTAAPSTKQRKVEAARDRLGVDDHRAAAAKALAAALARAKQVELLLQHLDQTVMRRDLGAGGLRR